MLMSVEIMNIDIKRWFSGPGLSMPWAGGWGRMKTAVVGNTCYFMGGFIMNGYTHKVYSVSLPVMLIPVPLLKMSGRRLLNCQLNMLLHSL